MKRAVKPLATRPEIEIGEACSTSTMPDEPQTPDKLQAKQLRGGEIYRQPGSRFRDRSRANNSGNLTGLQYLLAPKP